MKWSVKKLNQSKLNILNFSIALLALLISIPGVVYQTLDFSRESSERQTTTVRFYTPVTDIDPESALKNDIDCWGSIASPRRDAFRCSYGNSISDPCFELPRWYDVDRTLIHCGNGVADSSDGLLLSVVNTPELRTVHISEGESEFPPSEVLPWRIKLQSGHVCSMTTGSTDRAFGGTYIQYGCIGDDAPEVTNRMIVENKRYYFSCRERSSDFYSDCFASEVVY